MKVSIETEEEEQEKEEENSKKELTTNLENLLKYLSQNCTISENVVTNAILKEISKLPTDEDKQLMFDELKHKVQESEKQLEIKRKAAESAFNQATGSSSNNFDSNVIPGLDGDYEPSCASNLATNDLALPESLKNVLSKYKNVEELCKAADLLDDPIVKKFANLTDTNQDDAEQKDNVDEQLDEPMELDEEEEDVQNTIIEVNNLTTSSSYQFSDDQDEELRKKASLQIDRLKEMELDRQNQTQSQTN